MNTVKINFDGICIRPANVPAFSGLFYLIIAIIQFLECSRGDF